MKKQLFITYEEPFQNQIFTKEQLKEIYETLVNKTEYKDFTEWFIDMIRNEIFIEC